MYISWGLGRKERSQDKCVSYELGKVNTKWGCLCLEFTLGRTEDLKTRYKESMVEELWAGGGIGRRGKFHYPGSVWHLSGGTETTAIATYSVMRLSDL